MNSMKSPLGEKKTTACWNILTRHIVLETDSEMRFQQAVHFYKLDHYPSQERPARLPRLIKQG
jgi:hypothetical protein